MKLSAEQIKTNWDKLIQLIEDSFEGERKEKLLEMYEHFKDRMMFAPASSTYLKYCKVFFIVLSDMER